ncbi:MAG: hypothetical protein ACFFBP_21730 [Promethearchaeota archaeon]
MSEDIIQFLGQKLAAKIDKPLMPSKGIIRLAIKDDHGEFKNMTFDKLKYSLKNGLKKRLESINISNSDEVCNYLLKELISNQSLLTMAKF